MGQFNKPILALAVILFFAGQVLAQEGTMEGVSERRKVYPLSLDEASRLALTNNFDIQLVKYDTYIARTRQDDVESMYDTILEAEIGYRENKRKRTSTIAGTMELDNDYNLGISKKLPTGTTLSVDMLNNRSWTNSSFATTNPSHDSALEMTVEQELGKNFFGLQDRSQVKITQIEIINSQFSSLEKIEDDLKKVQGAYWDLVLYSEKVKIYEAMLEQAKALFDLNQKKLKDGLVENPDVIAAEANFEKHRNDLWLAQDEWQTRENVLKLLLNLTEDPVTLEPSDAFILDPQEQEWPSSLRKAFDHRSDYKRTVNELQAKDIQIIMDRNELWPEINLTTSLARNGVAQDDFAEAVTQISSETHPDFFVGMTFSMPMENRQAKSQLKKSELEKARALIALKLLEREIAVDVTDQVRHCNVLKQLAQNSGRIAQLQENKLREEEKRYRTGRSDTDTIIRFQDDLSQAKWQAAQDKHQYVTSVIELRQREGVLLSQCWQGEI